MFPKRAIYFLLICTNIFFLLICTNIIFKFQCYHCNYYMSYLYTHDNDYILYIQYTYSRYTPVLFDREISLQGIHLKSVLLLLLNIIIIIIYFYHYYNQSCVYIYIYQTCLLLSITYHNYVSQPSWTMGSPAGRLCSPLFPAAGIPGHVFSRPTTWEKAGHLTAEERMVESV